MESGDVAKLEIRFSKTKSLYYKVATNRLGTREPDYLRAQHTGEAQTTTNT